MVRQIIRLFVAGLVITSGVGLVAVSVQAQESARQPRVVVATVDGEITAGTVAYVSRTLTAASESGADYYLLRLNTPGGLLQATEDISRLLINSALPTIVYVHEDTGWAFSAGVFILLSAETAAMHPTASLGAATPVLSDGSDAGEKLTNATAAWVGALADRRDRPVELAQSLVVEAEAVSGVVAAELGLIDVVATTESEVLAALGVMSYERTVLAPTLSDRILSFISLPYLVPLLLSLGVLGLILAFRTGEIEFAGTAGVIFLLLGWWGSGAITISTLGLALLAVGVLLLAIELVYEPGFGVAGITGVLALLGSLLTFASEPLFPSYFASQLFFAAVGVWVAVGCIMIVMGRLALAAQLQPIAVGRESLYGRVVTVTHEIAPRGRVMIDGESFVAEGPSDGAIPAGQTVRITHIVGNTVHVVPVAVTD